MTGLLCTVFALSGAAGLLFETLWFRQAGLALGNSVAASSLVLASFMSGLALGSVWMARLGPRLRRPVLFYAGLEAAIAVTGVALVWLLPRMGELVAPLLGALPGPAWLPHALRFVLGATLLLIPATAMGATLPVMVRALQGRGAAFGPLLGWLYALNTGGAVLGSVAGELWLIEAFGVRGTALFAGGLDAIAAVTAVTLARGAPFAERTDSATEAPSADAAPAPRLSRAAWQLLASACLAGALLLALEVVWFRFLHLWIVSNGLTFALVLGVVLTGIGLGGGAGGLWLRLSPHAGSNASAVALFAGGFVCVLYVGFDWIGGEAAQHIVLQGWPALWLAVAIGGPVAFLSGVLFTLTGDALHSEVGLEARSAGLLTFWNTLGAAAGSLGAGLLLLPWLGMERSFFALASLYGVVALLLRNAGTAVNGSPWPARIPALALFVFSLMAFPFGLMRADYTTRPLRQFGYPATHEIVDVREGIVETVALLRARLEGEPLYHQIVMGTFSMAEGQDFSRRYQKVFAWWPVALHPDPRRALVVSYGMGSTARALADTAGLDRIDLVDVSPLVFEMSELAYPPGEWPLADPRVHAHVEDGRFFLRAGGEPYDIITAEPPSPRSERAESLYTREYFELVHARLADGGLNTHFLPLHLVTLSDAKAIIAAYCEVFEDCSLWAAGDRAWMLAGSKGGRFAVTSQQIGRQWRDPKVGPELRRLGLELPEQLGALFLGDAEQLALLVRDHPPLHDDRPKQLTPIHYGEADATWDTLMESNGARERFEASRFVQEVWPPDLRERSLPYFDVQGIVYDALRGTPGWRERIRLLSAIQTTTSLRTAALWLLRTTELEMAAVHRLLDRGAPEAPYLERLAAEALAERRFAEAADGYLEATSRRPDARHLEWLRAYASCMADGNGEDADGSCATPAE